MNSHLFGHPNAMLQHVGHVRSVRYPDLVLRHGYDAHAACMLALLKIAELYTLKGIPP
jgi:hypothetical protein